jgi:predicted nucleotide-binding protein (sugar kinase/HSP70/actin superfamily)
MGSYSIPMSTLGSMLECEIMVPPRMTKRTLELGTRHSPEFVCIPFKYNLGNFIEALDKGANLLIQAGGGCRFGYYGEVQEQILRDLGYDFQMLRLLGGFSLRNYRRQLKSINPRLTMRKAMYAYMLALRQTQALDRVEDFVRKNCGFEVERGSFDRVHAEFLRELAETRDAAAVEAVESAYADRLCSLAIDRPSDLLRVGIVGELYVLMEPFSNFFVEKELARRGCEVHRFVTVSDMVANSGRRADPHMKELLAEANPYLKYHIGADGTGSVATTHRLMREGFDGVLHLKPFGCMPEVNAMAALQRLSREHTFPILFISYDAQASETGLQTRLDAFCDMLRMRNRRSA